MKTYKTIAEVKAAVDAGELDESQLCVLMDNDTSGIYVGPAQDEDGNELDNKVFSGNGYYDIAALWALLFPKAQMERC